MPRKGETRGRVDRSTQWLFNAVLTTEVAKRVDRAIRDSGSNLKMKSRWFNDAVLQLLAIRPSSVWHGTVIHKASLLGADDAPTTRVQITLRPETRRAVNEALPGLIRYGNRTGWAEIEWHKLLGVIVRTAIEMRVNGELMLAGLELDNDWGDLLSIEDSASALTLSVHKPLPADREGRARLEDALDDAIEVLRERLNGT